MTQRSPATPLELELHRWGERKPGKRATPECQLQRDGPPLWQIPLPRTRSPESFHAEQRVLWQGPGGKRTRRLTTMESCSMFMLEDMENFLRLRSLAASIAALLCGGVGSLSSHFVVSRRIHKARRLWRSP